ncbi:MAG: 3-dehydroquinate synthase II [Nitrososphaerota archaeon]
MRKEIIIAPVKPDERILERAVARGIRAFYIDPEKLPEKLRGKIEIYHESESADWRIVRDPSSISEKTIPEMVLRGPEDYERMIAAARMGARSIIVRAEDLKIIALENLIADLAPYGTRIIAAASPHEVETLSGVLEKGVDGLLVAVSSPDEVDLVIDQVSAPSRLELDEAEVVEVRDIGLGERACIDTTSILSVGEGMLVGSTSSLLALIHNESLGSALTAPRPFRVNAGAIHSYTLAPDGSTRYLSELRAGDRVLVVSKRGVRIASIGRVKIERRPLRLVRIRLNDIEGSVIVQNAETIALLSPDEAPISATEIKPGDRILAHAPRARARHFGRAVDELIIER